MKYSIYLLLCMLILVSCKDFETKKISSDTFLKEELENIDMKALDEYPTFKSCDQEGNKKERLTCFENKIAQNFSHYLDTKILIVQDQMNDTVWVELSVTNEGEIKIEKTQIPELVQENIPDLGLWLHQSLDSLPQVYPAIKRGIPVRTTFKMPVLIKVE